MRRLMIFIAFIVLSMVIVSSVAGQETCSSVVNEALSQLSNNCGDLPRNSACYGFNNVQATFFDAFLPDAFSQPNDRADLATLQSINTSPSTSKPTNGASPSSKYRQTSRTPFPVRRSPSSLWETCS